MSKNLKKVIRRLLAGQTNMSEFSHPVNYLKAQAILERRKK